MEGRIAQPPSPERQVLRTYFEDLLYLLRRRDGGLAQQALRHAGLAREDVANASERLCFEALYDLLGWLQDSRALPLPGLQLGLRRCLGDFGIFGDALLVSSRSGEALYMAQRFYGSAWRHVQLDVFRERDQVVCRYRPLASANCHPVPLAQAMTAMSVAITRELVPGFDPERLEVRYGFPAPADAREYRRLLGCRVRFGHGWHEVRQPCDWLESPRAPSAVAAPAAALQALAAWQRQQCPQDIEQRVRALLASRDLQGDDGLASIEDVARRIGMASRTLRLQLERQGTSFRAVSREVRLEMARRYLAGGMLSVAEVAAIVGYRHVTSLHRAYREHFGRTPRTAGECG